MTIPESTSAEAFNQYLRGRLIRSEEKLANKLDLGSATINE